MTTSRKVAVTAGILALVGVCVIIAYAWFAPWGTGEYRDSPDGRYTAHAGNLTRGTVRFTRIQYLEIKLVRASDHRVVWRDDIVYSDPARAPDYGDRSQKSLQWSPDSTSFQVRSLDGKVKTIHVPPEE